MRFRFTTILSCPARCAALRRRSLRSARPPAPVAPPARPPAQRRRDRGPLPRRPRRPPKRRIATWFGPGFYGQHTACGQTLTPATVGVANRKLPCGTLVKVTYRGQGLTVPVRRSRALRQRRRLGPDRGRRPVARDRRDRPHRHDRRRRRAEHAHARPAARSRPKPPSPAAPSQPAEPELTARTSSHARLAVRGVEPHIRVRGQL